MNSQVLRFYIRVSLISLGLMLPAQAQCDSIRLAGTQLKWSGQFTVKEKARILRYFESSYACLYSRSQIVRTDIDKDGRPDYIVNARLRKGGEGKTQEVILVLRSNGTEFTVLSHTPKEQDTGLFNRRRLYAIDFDHDGLQDVIDQRQYDIGGEEPQAYAIVLHNTGKELTAVYSRNSYRPIQFRDLNGDGRYELIEWTNDLGTFESAPLWPVVYEWNGSSFVDASMKFPNYYQARTKEFQTALAEAQQRDQEFRTKTGRANPIEQDVIRAMKIYLARIQQMTDKKNAR